MRNKLLLIVGWVAFFGVRVARGDVAASRPATRPADGVELAGTAEDAAAARKADAERGKKTLAVLPFIGKTPQEKDLADKIWFAVSQKIGRDWRFIRADNADVQTAVSAVHIPWDVMPPAGDMLKILDFLDEDFVVMGEVQGKKLTLELYQGVKLKKQVSGEITDAGPGPRGVAEKLLADLLAMKFNAREPEVDHSDVGAEKMWAGGVNLAMDGDFEDALKSPREEAEHWWGILGDQEWHPKMFSLEDAEGLSGDQVVIVPKAMAGVEESREAHNGGDLAARDGAQTAQSGSCLLMRISKKAAENNGLACKGDWIQVEAGVKYRFSVKYHSGGPVLRIFIDGFAEAPDGPGDKKDPEATRREFYRAQILPRKANERWDLVERDFTPAASGKNNQKKIQWVRVDLYVYMTAGDVWVDDVVVKKVGGG